MKKYTKIHNDFSTALEKCKESSRKFMGIRSPTGAHFFASVLFTKLCVCSVSIYKLIPEPNMIGKDEHWDFASVASLTRNIVECYLVFNYLCIEKCSIDEWDARLQLMNLHDHMSRTKMFGDEDDKNSATEVKTDVMEKLKNNAWFQSLSEKQKVHYLKGNTAFFNTQDERVEGSGGDVSEFRFIYRFLSNYTHSFPMGFYRMGEHDSGRGYESEIEVLYTGICLQLVTKYITNAESEFVCLWENESK